MRTTKKYHKNIFFITTTSREKGFLHLHFENPTLMSRAKKGDLILFVYGDEKIKKAKTRDIEGHTNIKDLIIPYKESYVTLCEKTLKAIKYCTYNFNFDYIHKGDVTKVMEIEYLDIDKKNTKDYIGISAIRARKDKWGGFSHGGITRECTPCETRVFRKWANGRDLYIDSHYFDPSVYYSGWKPYSMSQKFARLIVKYGDPYNNLYKKYLAGCEDHMIGKIWKDLHLAFNLTMR